MTSNPFESFIENALQVLELLELHVEKNVDNGTRHKHEILLKSCVVLLVACWESFIEDTAEKALDFMIKEVRAPSSLPKDLQKFIAATVKSDQDELKAWDLAGEGWKVVVKDHRKAMVQKYPGPFNTPRAGNIDSLYKSVLGLPDVSPCWSWKRMGNKAAKDKLSALVTLRGAIAHRVQTSEKVKRSLVDGYAKHLLCLAIKTTNRVRVHVYSNCWEVPLERRAIQLSEMSQRSLS